MPDVRRPFKVPLYPYTPVFAMIGCIILAFYLNTNAIITACFFLVVGILVYYVNKKISVKPENDAQRAMKILPCQISAGSCFFPPSPRILFNPDRKIRRSRNLSIFWCKILKSAY